MPPELQFIAFATFFHIAGAAAIPLEKPKANHIYPRSYQDCGFEGNADIYGLGIRLGIYLQWSASFCASYLLPYEVISDLANTSRWFNLAIFIALAVMTKDFPSTHAPEVLIMLYIYFGFQFVVLPATLVRPTILKALTTYLLSLATSSYSIWFWQIGIKKTYRKTGCVSYGFLLAKVSLHEPSVDKAYTTFAIIFSVITTGLLWMLFRFLWSEFPPLSSLNPLSKPGRFQIAVVVKKQITIWLSPPPTLPAEYQNQEALSFDNGVDRNTSSCTPPDDSQPQETVAKSNSPNYVTPTQNEVVGSSTSTTRTASINKDDDSDLAWTRISTVFICRLFSLAYSILGIELTLSWNQISGVYDSRSVGQLIPLVIGISGMVQVIYYTFKKWWLDEGDNPSTREAEKEAERDRDRSNFEERPGSNSLK